MQDIGMKFLREEGVFLFCDGIISPAVPCPVWPGTYHMLRYLGRFAGINHDTPFQ